MRTFLWTKYYLAREVWLFYMDLIVLGFIRWDRELGGSRWIKQLLSCNGLELNVFQGDKGDWRQSHADREYKLFSWSSLYNNLVWLVLKANRCFRPLLEGKGIFSFFFSPGISLLGIADYLVDISMKVKTRIEVEKIIWIIFPQIYCKAFTVWGDERLDFHAVAWFQVEVGDGHTLYMESSRHMRWAEQRVNIIVQSLNIGQICISQLTHTQLKPQQILLSESKANQDFITINPKSLDKIL